MMGRPRKYFMTDEIIAQLTDHTILLHEIAKQSGIPRKTLTKWSVTLGVARQINWTAEDEAYLRKHIGKKTIAQLAKKLRRSEDAIKEKCRCMALSRAPRDSGYTLKTLRWVLRAASGQ